MLTRAFQPKTGNGSCFCMVSYAKASHAMIVRGINYKSKFKKPSKYI